MSRVEFLKFYRDSAPSNYKKFCAIADRASLFYKQVTLACDNKLCQLCNTKLPTTSVLCRSCFATPEGKAFHKDRVHQTRVRTNLVKYGTSNPMKSKQVQRKLRKTLLSKYGVSNAMFLPKVREKHKESVRRSHNTPEYLEKARLIQLRPGHKEKVQRTLSRTNLERYGVTNPMLSKEGRRPWEKATRYWRSKEGRKEISRLVKEGSLRSLGVDNAFKSKEVKDKIKKTLLERYGVDHPLKKQRHQKKSCS